MSRPYVLGLIRQFRTAQFTVVVDAVEEESPDFSFDESGETLAKCESGEWQVFAVRARVLHDQLGEIAADYLGNCIYADPAEFQDHRECGAQTRKLRAEGSTAVCGSYFSDMVRNVCRDARKAIKGAHAIRVRARENDSV